MLIRTLTGAVAALFATYAGPASFACANGLAAAPEAEFVARAGDDTPSGYPVPRFVGLAADHTNCRVGPSLQHPIKYVFQKRFLPVLVIAETSDHWRKIRDFSGDECWAFHTVVRAPSHALVISPASVYARPAADSPPRGRLEKGVLARVGRHKGDWTFVAAGPARGWVKRVDLWGVAPP